MTEAEIEKKWENTPWDTDIYLDDIDKRPQTNEEWIKSATTEELAEWIAKCIKDTIIFTNGNRKYTDNIVSIKWWVEWLKQPHTKGVADANKMAKAYKTETDRQSLLYEVEICKTQT